MNCTYMLCDVATSYSKLATWSTTGLWRKSNSWSKRWLPEWNFPLHLVVLCTAIVRCCSSVPYDQLSLVYPLLYGASPSNRVTKLAWHVNLTCQQINLHFKVSKWNMQMQLVGTSYFYRRSGWMEYEPVWVWLFSIRLRRVSIFFDRVTLVGQGIN